MKKLLASVAFAALMATSGSAFALNLGVAAVVDSHCVIPNGGTITTLGFVTDGNGAIVPGGPSQLASVPNSLCTGPAKIKLQTLKGGVQLNGVAGPQVAVPPLGFANFIPYSATATWSTLTATVNATNVAPTTVLSAGATPTAFTGTLLVTGTTGGTGGLPLVAGTYSDTLVVEIVAQ
jgi:hypothetical protein